MTDKLHPKFIAWIEQQQRDGKLTPQQFKLADLAARWIHVLEEIPEPSETAKVEAEKAIKNFEEAMKVKR